MFRTMQGGTESPAHFSYAISQVLNNPLCVTLQRYGKAPQKPPNTRLSGRLGQSARVRNSFIYDLVLF